MVKYVIITAARNEEKYISHTLDSVSKQTILPQKWVIMNDNSTDRTSEIIDKYVIKHAWLKKVDLINFKPELKTTGGRVGHILNIAAKQIDTDYDFIVKLDADTSFEPDFFERLLNEFDINEKLGVASGHLVFMGQKEHVDYKSNITRGAVMVIRKEVFRDTNGFLESKGRGEDRMLSVAARHFGWETRTFPVFFNHLKPEAKRHSSIHESFNTGFYKGSIPYLFTYFLATQLKYIKKRPFFFGSVLQICGYFYSRFIIRYKPFPPYVAKQLRKEQKDFFKIIK